MKGFLLAAFLSAAYASIVVVRFRISAPRARAGYMTRLHLGFLPILIFLFVITPADLGFLPASLTETNAWLDFSFGVFAYSASVLGGWLQLYNVADRGLSLRILIDANELDDGIVTPSFLEKAYGAGKGISWMYGKRVSDLERLQLMQRNDTAYVLTEKGLRTARVLLALRALYSISTPARRPR